MPNQMRRFPPSPPFAISIFVMHNSVVDLKGKKPYKTLDRQRTCKAWEKLDEGKTSVYIENHGITSRRNADRLREVRRSFTDRLSVQEIATQMKWSEEHVKEVWNWWEYYLRTIDKRVRQDHIKKLIVLVNKLRKLTFNPEIQEQKYATPSTWDWGGQNWRLIPDIWFLIMTPYLDDAGLWGQPLINLQRHLASSSFWRHYNDLRDQSLKLSTEYNEAAKKMNPSLYNEWVEFKDRLAEFFISTWIPNKEQRPIEIEEIPYGTLKCREMLNQFSQFIPNLHNRFRDMEYKLQRLYDDINSAEIEETIKDTHCDEC